MERVNHNWFHIMAATHELPRETLKELSETGFTVMAGPVVQDEFARIVAAYDSAVLAAHPNDVSVGRSTTRVNDFVNRGPDFDQFYVYPYRAPISGERSRQLSTKPLAFARIR